MLTGRWELPNRRRPSSGRQRLRYSRRPTHEPTGIKLADGNALDCCCVPRSHHGAKAGAGLGTLWSLLTGNHSQACTIMRKTSGKGQQVENPAYQLQLHTTTHNKLLVESMAREVENPAYQLKSISYGRSCNAAVSNTPRIHS